MRVLLGWELGAGMGHLSPHRDLLSALVERGHEVHAVVRDVSRAQRAFSGLQLSIWQAPIALESPDPLYRPTATFAQVLHNGGYGRTQPLYARTLAWENLIDVVRPDLVLVDYAPSLLICLRGRGIPSAVIATGFFVPPKVRPLPVYCNLQGRLPLSVATSDAPVLQVINEVLHLLGRREVQGVDELFYDGVTPLLKTFPELDHYPERTGGIYMGSPPSPVGVMPVWPEGNGPRIFGYLKPFPAAPQLFAALRRLKFPTLIASDGLPRALREEFECETLRFSEDPVDLWTVTETCALAINNANHGSAAHFLLKGIPLFVAPIFLEQEIIAMNVMKMKAGQVVRQTSEEIEAQLVEMLEQSSYGQAARSFANRQAGLSMETFRERVLSHLRSMVAL